MQDAAGVMEAAAEAARTAPVETLNPAQADLFAADAMWPIFARLRREAPVHYTADSPFGSFWSVTRYREIVEVDTDYEAFSSGGHIRLMSQSVAANVPLPGFIAMDPPEHGAHRKTVSPSVSPANLARLGPIIRERAIQILDGLPVGEEFDWVDKVSMELTAATLATLLDFPFEDRRKLTHWTDMISKPPGGPGSITWEEKVSESKACFAAFTDLWNERAACPVPGHDLVSLLANGEATRDMSMEQYHGTMMLLLIGGNDTTRNTLSGSIYALNKFPDQYARLREDPSLVASLTSESIRWQTPAAHMMRTATRDVELGGQLIRKGDRVVMWYVSGNRDETHFEDPDAFRIDRERPRNHLSFGFGIHRCVGNRLAELQFSIIWEELLKRFPEVVVTGEPERTRSIFVRGYENLPVVIPRRH